MEFIKTIKLAASHKWILVAQILADAPPPPQTVNVIASIETLMQGYISPEPQFKKVWQGDTGFLSHNCKEAKLHIIAYVKLLVNK